MSMRIKDQGILQHQIRYNVNICARKSLRPEVGLSQAHFQPVNENYNILISAFGKMSLSCGGSILAKYPLLTLEMVSKRADTLNLSSHALLHGAAVMGVSQTLRR